MIRMSSRCWLRVHTMRLARGPKHGQAITGAARADRRAAQQIAPRQERRQRGRHARRAAVFAAARASPAPPRRAPAGRAASTACGSLNAASVHQAGRRQHVARQQAARWRASAGHVAQRAGHPVGRAQIAQPRLHRCIGARAARPPRRPAPRARGTSNRRKHSSVGGASAASPRAPRSWTAAAPSATSPAAMQRAQRRGHLVAARRALDHLAPPLQPDQRQRRLARHFLRPRQLMIERIQREQRLAPRRRGEQGAEIPVRVVPAHQYRQGRPSSGTWQAGARAGKLRGHTT